MSDTGHGDATPFAIDDPRESMVRVGWNARRRNGEPVAACLPRRAIYQDVAKRIRTSVSTPDFEV